MRREQVCAPGRRRAGRPRGCCASGVRGAQLRHSATASSPGGAATMPRMPGAAAPPKPNYGTFFTVYPSDRRQSEAWVVSFIGVLAGAFLAGIGVLGRDVVFAAASIVFGAAFVVGAAVDAGWSRGLVSVDMVPVGCVTVRPSARLTVLRIVTVVCAILALVLYGFSFLPIRDDRCIGAVWMRRLLRSRHGHGDGWALLVLSPAAGAHRARAGRRDAARQGWRELHDSVVG